MKPLAGCLLALASFLPLLVARAAEPASLEEAEAAYKSLLAEADAQAEALSRPITEAEVAALKPEDFSLEKIYGCDGERQPFVAVVAGYEWSWLDGAPFLRLVGIQPRHKYTQTRKLSRPFHEELGWANVETYSWVDGAEIVADIEKAVGAGRCRPIVVMGYSYGGDTVSQVVKELKARGLFVDLSIELDTIGRSDQKVPDNVGRAVCVWQEEGPLRGNDHLEGGMLPPIHVNLGPVGHGRIALAPGTLSSVIGEQFAQVRYPGVNRMSRRRSAASE